MSNIGWLSETMTHYGAMNHNISHRENEIGFFTPPYTFHSSSCLFWTLFSLHSKTQFSQYSIILKKKSKPFFRFSDPHFGQFITSCQKLQFSLRAFTKWAEWRFWITRGENQMIEPQRVNEDLLPVNEDWSRNERVWLNCLKRMDKENDISGSLDCVFKVPMDPNSLKTQEQFYFWPILCGFIDS